MKKAMLTILLLFIFVATALPQYTIRPSTLSVQNVIRTAPNVINFSVYFKNTAVDSAIAYSGGQIHLDFNKVILNGGTGTLAIINSGLPANVQSTNPTVYTTSTPGQLRVAPKAPPGALVGGYLVNPGDSVLVAKFSLSTSAASFLNWTSHSIAWRKVPDANPVSKVSAYIWNSNQIISTNTNFYIYPTASKELNVTALIEGFFDGTNMVPDTASIELHNAVAPYGLVEKANVNLSSIGNAIANFYTAAEATDYYIVVKHRNSIETWSKLPQQFSSGVLTYDFTTSASQAYGDNLKLKSGKYCIYSGDVNGSGTINVSDINTVFVASNLGLTGYVVTDVNGSNTVNVTDINITFANSNLGASVQKPTVLSTGMEVEPVIGNETK